MDNKKLELLKPDNSVLLMIDYQPQMAFGVANIDRQTLKNNAIGLAKSALLYKVPTILTSVETEGFSGYVFPELLDVFPIDILPSVNEGDSYGAVHSFCTDSLRWVLGLSVLQHYSYVHKRYFPAIRR